MDSWLYDNISKAFDDSLIVNVEFSVRHLAVKNACKVPFNVCTCDWTWHPEGWRISHFHDVWDRALLCWYVLV